MRARAHRVEQLAQTGWETAATCSWERSTCSHSMRTVSRSSLGPLPPSCRRCPNCAALGRGLVAAAFLHQILHTQQATGFPRKVVFCLTGPYLTRRATIGRLEPPLGRGRFVWHPPTSGPHKYNGLYGPGFISVMRVGL